MVDRLTEISDKLSGAHDDLSGNARRQAEAMHASLPWVNTRTDMDQFRGASSRLEGFLEGVVA